MSENVSNSRLSLWLIAALCLLPVIASYLAYYVAPPDGHTNYGELMNAPPLPEAELRLADGAAFNLGQLRGKWILLMSDTARCDEGCRRTLFTLRQLRLTQGKNMERIERAWLISDDDGLPAGIADDYRGTWFIRAAASDLLRRLPAARSPAEHIYIVDPLGNIVLRYARGAEPGKMIKDITRLLKTSRIG